MYHSFISRFFPSRSHFSITLFLFIVLSFHSQSSWSSVNLQLASIYEEPENIEDYWVSEKLDGVRGYWDGRTLLTKSGNKINAPHWFTEGWPNSAMEGELWSGLNQFEQISGCVRKKVPSDCWLHITFNLFDLPDNKNTFTERIRAMKALVSLRNINHLKMIPQNRYSSTEQLMEKLESYTKALGEGLMLHHQDAFYTPGRSHSILKLKKYSDDEAVVLEYVAGKGKYENQLGSLKVKTKDGIVFKIGSGFSDKQRKNPPPINSIITFKYIGKTQRGVPRFASFMRIRHLCESPDCLISNK